jgi:hypothetical protein
VREKMIAFLQQEHPEALPVQRVIADLAASKDVPPSKKARSSR